MSVNQLFKINPDHFILEKLLEAFQNEIDLHNNQFGSWEQVKKFQLTSDEWTITEGHLTPTMKLKRKVIAEKYADLIDSMYL